MKEIEKVYLTGLGAIGCAFASRIYACDPASLKVIADRNRIERYSADGVFINNRKYDFDYVEPEKANEKADLILIAVKQHHLAQSIEDIRNFVGEGTIILPLQNGITSEEIVGAEFGMDKLLYSFCVGTDTVREGTSTTFTNIGKIFFGEKTNKVRSEKVCKVAEYFDRVSIPYTVPENMLREQWWKFMMNVGLNQVSAILRAPYGVFAREGEARELMLSASREVMEISRKAGIGLSEEDIWSYLIVLERLAPEGKTSMLQDVEAKRKTEVEIFAGTVTELGKRHGVPTPVNDVLYRLIRAIEQIQEA